MLGGIPPPELNLFDPPSSAAEKRKEKENLDGKALPSKIAGFRLFFAKMALFPAKMAEFTAIWRAFSYITFLSPPLWRLWPCTCMMLIFYIVKLLENFPISIVFYTSTFYFKQRIWNENPPSVLLITKSLSVENFQNILKIAFRLSWS